MLITYKYKEVQNPQYIKMVSGLACMLETKTLVSFKLKQSRKKKEDTVGLECTYQMYIIKTSGFMIQKNWHCENGCQP